MVPARPVEEEFAGTVFDITRLAAKMLRLTVRTDALPDGFRRTKTLSVAETFEAVGSSETFLLLSAIY